MLTQRQLTLGKHKTLIIDMKPKVAVHFNQQDRPAPPGQQQITDQLERILGSPAFSRSSRLSAFLRFVTEQTIAGNSRTLKQYTIGVEVYLRETSFDPKSDPIVRIEAGRLRRTLKKYYTNWGESDRVLIQIPRGTYVPEFTWSTVANKKASAEPAPIQVLQPPMIAVFPMENQGNEAHAYLVDGFGEQLTVTLSRFSDLRVIAYCSTASFKGGSKDIPSIASTLGADFALTGSLRTAGKRIRLSFNLLDVASGEHLWSNQFDEDLAPENLFDIEDKIVRRIVGQVADRYGIIPRAMSSQAKYREVSDPSVYEAILRCFHYEVTLTIEAFRESRLALERASIVEPNCAMVWAMLSQLYLDSQVFGYETIPDALPSGIRFALRAVTLDPSCQYSQYARAYASLIERDRTTMISAAEKIVAINPNAASMVGAAGFWLCIAGEYERGINLFHTGTALNPLHPSWLQAAPYFYHMHKGDLKKSLYHANEFGLPDFFWGPMLRAAVLGLLGYIADAKTEHRKLLALKPDFAEKARDYVSFFLLDEELIEKMLAGLRNSGL